MIDLARRSGQVVSLDARAVYEGDKFDVVLGLDSRIDHVPDWQNANRTDPKKLTFVYAIAKLKDGGYQFEVMSRAEVDAIRARSKAKDDGPWVTDYAAMAIKTVVRRLFKFLPVSIEMQTAIGLDEQADAGVNQQMAAVLDGEYAVIDDHSGSGAEPSEDGGGAGGGDPPQDQGAAGDDDSSGDDKKADGKPKGGAGASGDFNNASME